MKRIGRALAVVAIGSLCSISPGCSKGHRAAHPAERQTPEAPPPTPDTTPVEVLRTPAGLVLGVEGTPAPAPPATATSVPAAPATPPPGS
jgi:hypothetical protein